MKSYTQVLHEAVKVAKAKTDNDILIMVTVNHSHGLTISTSPYRLGITA